MKETVESAKTMLAGAKKIIRLLVVCLILFSMVCNTAVVYADDVTGQETEANKTEEQADDTERLSIDTAEPSDEAERSEEAASPDNPAGFDGMESGNDGKTEKVSATTDGSPFSAEKTVDGVTVSVSADAGVFPNDTSLSVSKIGKSEQDEAERAVDEVRDDDRNVAASYTFDISLHDADGNEIEPNTSAGAVKVTFSADLIANDNLETEIYHIEDGANASAEKLDIVTEDSSSVTVETDGFSTYAICFTYDKLEYVLSKGAELRLAKMLAQIGITGDITNAEGSNERLFTLKQEAGEWVLKANQPFSTGAEWLKVTMRDGATYEIAIRSEETTPYSDNWLSQYAFSKDDANKTITLNKFIPDKEDNDIELTVPATITEKSNLGQTDLYGYSVQLTGDVYLEQTKIKSIVFEDNVKFVGDASRMFESCQNLQVLDVSGVDTSEVTNMSSMFWGCESLTALDVSEFDTSNVTSMSGMFNQCKSLTELDVSKFNTSKVTSMAFMFSFCTNLNEIDLANFDTSKCIYMSDMFDSCQSIKNLDLSSFDTSNAVAMERIFMECRSLTKIDLSHFNTSKVTNMYAMFSHCPSLTYLDLSTFDMRNVQGIQGMFGVCQNLQTIVVSEKWSLDSIGKDPYGHQIGGVFYFCNNLVGQNGTKYADMGDEDSNKDYIYAHIDLPGNPGLLTGANTHKVSGKITDQNKKAISNVMVEILSSDGDILATVTSDADGSYSVSGLFDGQYTVRATAGDNEGTASAVISGGDASADVKIAPPEDTSTYAVSGTAKDRLGHSLYGVTVTIRPAGANTGGRTATTRMDGSFRIEGIQNGTYEIRASYRGVTGTASLEIAGADKTDVKITVIISRPDRPHIMDWTDSRIHYHPEDGYEYNISRGNSWNPGNGATWNTDGVFSGLLPETAYTIVKRDRTNPSLEESDGTTVITNRSGGISAVADEQEYGNGTILSSVELQQDAPQMSLDAFDEAFYNFIMGSLLTDEEREAVQNSGKTLSLSLGVDRKDRGDVPATERTLIDNAARQVASGAEVGMYMDLNFHRNLGGDGNKPITDLSGHAMTVNFTVPAEFAAPSGVTRMYHVIRLHDGVAEVLQSNRSREFSFKTDKFSTYALVYTDSSAESVSKGSDSHSSDTKGNATLSSSTAASASSSSSSSSAAAKSYEAGKGATKAFYVKNGKGTVRYDMTLVADGAKTAKVPATVRIGKKTYKVTAISSKAFSGYDKLTGVIIGKNVKKIGKRAFDGCTDLKTLTVNTKYLTKKGVKDSLKGSSVKTIEIPSDKVKTYQKIFTKEIAGSKGKVTVKTDHSSFKSDTDMIK